MEGNNPDDNDVWTPPESTQDPYSTDNNVTYTSGSVTYPASSSGHYATGTHFEQYQPDDARVVSQMQFSDSSYQSQIYQPSQSSYERISPVDEYRDVSTGNEAMSSYSTIQPPDGAQLMAAPSVVSSSLHQSGFPMHQVVLSSDHRVLTVQRVISPVDCTVSQSSLGLQDTQPTHALLTPVSSVQQYSAMHIPVTSMPSHGEITSSGSDHMTDPDHDHNVSGSSINDPIQSNIMSSISHKQVRHIEPTCISGEPDTTQDDSQDYQGPSHVRRYVVEESSSIDDAEPVLHSTMTPGSSIHTSSGEIMDSTMDSTGQLSSTQGPGLHMRDVALESDIERAVDSSAIGGNIGHASVSVTESRLVSVEEEEDGEEEEEEDDEDDDDDDDDNDDETLDSTIDDHENIQIPVIPDMRVSPQRKSHRLAEMEQEPPSWQRAKYVSKPYNPNELWCEECMTTYNSECPTHRIQIIPDKVVLSRAWASLPPMLQIFRIGDSDTIMNEPHVGVFAKRTVPKFTQFGPFIGELVDNRERVTSSKFLLLLERAGGEILYFETTDENKCNWMMFVRPAENFAEQNLVAYQHGLDIYFTVTKNIEARTELKVWYATHYAERFGFPTLEITEEDIEVLDQQDCKFQCYECCKRFRTSVALQRHLVLHESNSRAIVNEEPLPGPSTSSNGDMRKKTTSGFQSQKGKAKPAKKIKDFGETSGYVWKKKSTSIYLNKTLKKYQRRYDPEAIRRTIMYRKKGKESGGNEWVCVHCDLTFDNSNLLNLHTLTHAAENIGLDEVRRFAYSPYGNGILTQQDPSMSQNGEVVSIESSLLACPVCQMQFQDQRALIEHAAEHGTAKRKLGRDRPHKCDKCWKAFHTQERLQRHMLCHGEEDSKPLQCDVCFKRFMNNSALSCHMKTHSDRKYYECPICHEGFDHTAAMKDHVVIHAINGIYTCPECNKQFDDFFALRKHMRGFHTNKEFPCPDCDKKFPRPDKLKLHMLRHSTHREFMCENCGRQFKRKDKLKEHIRRMHSLEREAKNATRGDRTPTKKFVPKVSPTDYHRFIYKCHACLLGFKRRGMLVNHLAKRHPEVKPDTVPELNLPILKTQKDYYCNYCDKVYKSSSKRKAHIIKNHPGASLPLSSRKKSVISEIPGLPNPTFSQTVGSITTMPHSCEFCHKQYASKAKLTQHQRKKHPESVPPLPPKPKREMPEDIQPRQEPQPSQEAATIHHVVRYPEGIAAVQQQQPPEGIQAADLLTQAMSELTQTLQEYRQPVGEYHVQARIGQTGTPTMVQVQAHLQQNPHSTIELSHLGQTLAHAHFSTQPGTAAMVTPVQVAVAGQLQQVAQPQQQEQPSQTPQISQGQQAVQSAAPHTQSQTLLPQTIVVSGAPTQAIPVSLPPNTFIARSWPNYQNYR